MKRQSLIRTSRDPDYWLIATVIILLIVGAILIYSATSGFSPERGPAYVLLQHLARVAIGALLLYAASKVDYHWLQRWPVPLLIAGGTFALLAALQLANMGNEEGQAIRWFAKSSLGQSIQPSEMAKPAMIIYMAAWLASKGDKIRQVSYGLIPFSILLGLMTGMILAQPDLSTAMVIALTAVVMFFIAGADLKQLGLLTVLAMGSAPLLIRKEYMVDRIESWVKSITSSEVDIAGIGRQSYQTTTALAAGGLAGVGFGGSQHKAAFGNVAHTDLIMAVAGEEMGLLGSLLIIGLFIVFAYRGIKIAHDAADAFGSLLAVGITVWIVVQAIIHAGVVSELTPVTGMPLPFISYGGSALIMEMAGVGLLINISKQGIREGIKSNAILAFGRGNGRSRLPRVRNS